MSKPIPFFDAAVHTKSFKKLSSKKKLHLTVASAAKIDGKLSGNQVTDEQILAVENAVKHDPELILEMFEPYLKQALQEAIAQARERSEKDQGKVASISK